MTVMEALHQELTMLTNQRKDAEQKVIGLKRQEDKLRGIIIKLDDTPANIDRRKRPMPQAQKDKISAALKSRYAAKKSG
jgi:hypothetical protein